MCLKGASLRQWELYRGGAVVGGVLAVPPEEGADPGPQRGCFR